MAKDQRIAIVGIGCVFPGGKGPEGFWDLVARAGDASEDIPQGRWPVDASEYYEASLGQIDRVGSRRGCFVPKAQYDTSDLPLEQKLVFISIEMGSISVILQHMKFMLTVKD